MDIFEILNQAEATENEMCKQIALLHKSNPNYNVVNQHHETPLFIAYSMGLFEVFIFLVKLGADPFYSEPNESKSISPIELIIDADNAMMMDKLITNGIDLLKDKIVNSNFFVHVISPFNYCMSKPTLRHHALNVIREYKYTDHDETTFYKVFCSAFLAKCHDEVKALIDKIPVEQEMTYHTFENIFLILSGNWANANISMRCGEITEPPEAIPDATNALSTFCRRIVITQDCDDCSSHEDTNPSPLHLLLSQDNVLFEHFVALSEIGYYFNEKNVHGESLLKIAQLKQRDDIVQYLISKGAEQEPSLLIWREATRKRTEITPPPENVQKKKRGRPQKRRV